MRPSNAEYNGIKNVSTFEMMLTVPIEAEFFGQLLSYVWDTQRKMLKSMIHQIIQREGRFVDFLFQIRQDVRMEYLRELSDFANAVQLQTSDCT